MQLTHLRAFVTLAHVMNFTRSAEKLFITQPTLTFRIKELERELGYPLFNRTNRTVELTQEGDQFLIYVEQALKMLDDGLKEVRRSNRSTWHLVVTCIPVFGFYYLPSLYSFIRANNLPLEITLKTRRSSEEVLRFIKDGGSQIGILNINLVSLPRNYRVLALLEDTSCLVRGANFPLSENQILTLQELQQLPMVSYERNHPYWINVQGFFTNNNIQPNIILEVDNFEIVKQLLNRGFGISILPRIAIERELASGTLVEIKTEIPLNEKHKICAIYPRRNKLPETASMFIEALRNFLKDNQANVKL